MDTPIYDFVTAYRNSEALRLHMPGHKGTGLFGIEAMDITEIEGADVLYHSAGIIRRSEENAAALFGTARTVYSTEGSSLSIRAMLYLTLLYGKSVGRNPVIAAGRNAHKAFLTAAALLDIDPIWIFPEKQEDLLSCEITAVALERMFARFDDNTEKKPVAVYITSPDYLGHVADIRTLAEVCHRHGALLLVDNAHGAYLNFLSRAEGQSTWDGDARASSEWKERGGISENRKFLSQIGHPIALGADLCCDSGHKTLPVLTGGAYLHIAKTAPSLFSEQAESAMSLFASTSPSYLILQSLDLANRYLAEGYRENLARYVEMVAALKDRLIGEGYTLIGSEPLKLTIDAKAYGYTGEAMAELLAGMQIICEFADPDYVVMMLTPENGQETLNRIRESFLGLRRKLAITERMPDMDRPKRVMSPREALFSVSRQCELGECRGKVLATATVSCPPAIPILVCGEVIDESALRVMEYYGVASCSVVGES